MKLYLVKRPDRAGYDEYDCFVCAAENEHEARNSHPSGSDYEWTGKEWRDGNFSDNTWPDPTILIVTEIGAATSEKRKIVCASFNAG